jgi:hypothetical protein
MRDHPFRDPPPAVHDERFVARRCTQSVSRLDLHEADVTRFDVDHQDYNPEWEMEDVAEWDLSPIHIFNSTSSVVSLFGFWVWLFFSPHMSDVARDLDRTCMKPDRVFCTFQSTQMRNAVPSSLLSCLMMSLFSFTVGSYFALQWLANLLVAATALGQSCIPSETAKTVFI